MYLFMLFTHSRAQRPLSGQHQESRSLGWFNIRSPEARDSGTSLKSDKSDWLRIRNEYCARAQKIGSGQGSRFLVLTNKNVASGAKNVVHTGTQEEILVVIHFGESTRIDIFT